MCCSCSFRFLMHGIHSDFDFHFFVTTFRLIRMGTVLSFDAFFSICYACPSYFSLAYVRVCSPTPHGIAWCLDCFCSVAFLEPSCLSRPSGPLTFLDFVRHIFSLEKLWLLPLLLSFPSLPVFLHPVSPSHLFIVRYRTDVCQSHCQHAAESCSLQSTVYSTCVPCVAGA